MKRLLLAFAAVFCAANVFAGGFGKDFKNHIGAGDIKTYAKEMGLMVGSANFHDGRATSFPGFDVGVTGIFLDPSNKISKSADNDFEFLPMVYGEARIPVLGFNLAARGTSYDDFTTIGGGVKYSVVGATILPFFPDITAGVFYDRMGTDYYDADHFSAYISASVKVLILEPYIGFGYDYTDLEVKSTGTAFDGKSYDADGGRTTIGLNVTPFPFGYIFGAYTYAGDAKIYQAGLGVRF
ncbi:hypothetical protein Dip510_000101 [Elusimicrobium posterum]|uniref:hypothetical protein n=1 Tax=Elusimicrobium posterum TaxID=3116653 RepID=UPI003C76F5E0